MPKKAAGVHALSVGARANSWPPLGSTIIGPEAWVVIRKEGKRKIPHLDQLERALRVATPLLERPTYTTGYLRA
jgi:hypothetical protein